MQFIKKLLCLSMILAIISSSFCTALADSSTQTNTATTTAEEGVAASDTTVPLPTEFSDIDYETILGKAVETLTEAGVFTGYPDGTFKTEQTLTRAEFAKIIVSFKDPSLTSSDPSGFPDVDDVGGSSHWAKSYIKIANDMGIISGFPDGTFKPDSPVTYEQATKMILCSLGYTNLEYPQGYIQTAGQKRLFVNSTHQGATSEPITRGSTAILINNAYSIPQNDKISTETPGATTGGGGGGGGGGGAGGGGGGGGGGNIILPDDLIQGPTAKSFYGVIWGTYSTMIDTTRSDLYDTQIAIMQEVKDADTKEVTLKLKTYNFPESMVGKYDKYLGKYVKMTVTENDDGDEYVSKIDASYPKKNYSVDVKLDDFIRFYDENQEDDDPSNDETQSYVLSYYNSDDKKAALKFASPDKLYLIYNGKSINVASAEEYVFNPALMNDLKIGSFKFLSYDGDKKIDLIMIDSYKTAVVNQKNTGNNTMTFLDGNRITLEKTESNITRERVTITNSDTGKDMTLSEISKYDVIDYKESLDGLILSIYVTSGKKVVSGTVNKLKLGSEIVTPGEGETPDVTRTILTDESTIEVKNSSGKKTYTFNPYFIESFNENTADDKYIPMADDSLKVYFDKDGKIAHMEYNLTTANSKYGYITTMAFKVAEQEDTYISDPDDVASEDIPVLKMYQVSSKSYTKTPVEVASKVIVDGNIYTNNPVAVYDRLKLAAEVANHGKDDPRNHSMTFASFVRYEESGGKITVIDTILDKEGNLSTETDERYNLLVRSDEYVYDESEDAPSNLANYRGKHTFYGYSPYGFHTGNTSRRFKVTTSTNILFVPGNRTSSTEYSLSKFALSNFTHGMRYYVEAYNLNSSNNAEFVLMYMSTGREEITAYTDKTSTMAVITEILDPEKDEVDNFTVKYRNHSGTTVSTILINDDYPAWAKRNELNVGDVILFSKSNDGKSIYNYYHSLNVTDLPVGRIDNPDLFYCKSNIDDRRIKGFATYPTDTNQDYTSDSRYRTVYGTAVAYDSSSSSSSATITLNPTLSTDYLAPSSSYDEYHSINSSTRLFLYDENTETITAYTNLTTVKNFLSGEVEDVQGLITVSDNGDNYAGADHVFIYTSTSDYAKIIYVIRSADQQANPAPYSEDVDTLALVRPNAIADLESYVTVSDYPAIRTNLEAIIADGKEAIKEAASEEAINTIVTDAKASIDALTSSYNDLVDARNAAIAELTDYADLSSYEGIRDTL